MGVAGVRPAGQGRACHVARRLLSGLVAADWPLGVMMNRFLVAWMLVGCADVLTRWEQVSYIDEGRVCLRADGEDVLVTVVAPDCLSSSCSRDLDGSCEATVKGGTITVSSEITWEQAVYVGPGGGCTDDCGAPLVECTIEGGLADGTYDVVIGEETTTVDLPDEGCDLY